MAGQRKAGGRLASCSLHPVESNQHLLPGDSVDCTRLVNLQGELESLRSHRHRDVRQRRAQPYGAAKARSPPNTVSAPGQSIIPHLKSRKRELNIALNSEFSDIGQLVDRSRGDTLHCLFPSSVPQWPRGGERSRSLNTSS